MVLPVSVSEAVEALSRNINYRILNGTSDAPGGGDYTMIDIGTPLLFGIVHGSPSTKAPITIFTRSTETVGLIREDNWTRALNMETYAVMRLDSLLEFNDTDRDGRYEPPLSRYELRRTDSPVKKVDLSLNWEASQVRAERTSDGFRFKIDLLARNVPYTVLGGRTADTSPTANAEMEEAKGGMNTAQANNAAVLDEVGFNITIVVSREGKVAVIPTYSLKDGYDDSTYLSVKRDRTYNLTGAGLVWKMDHRIIGWDFDRGNTNPALLMSFSLHFGKAYRSRVSWGADRAGELLGTPSRVTANFSGERRILWEERAGQTMKSTPGIGEGEIDYGGEERKAWFHWRERLGERASLSASDERARLFIYGISLEDAGSEIWNNPLLKGTGGAGISIKGGYTYPPSASIIHDPGMGTVGYFPVEDSRTGSGGGENAIVDLIREHTTATVIITIGVIIIAIGAAAVLTYTRRGGLVHDEELRWEQEEELFLVDRRKKDWDSLKVK